MVKQTVKRTVIVNGLSDLHRITGRLAPYLKPGDLLLFEGEIGTGKTTFISSLCKKMKIQGPITSPTFTLINRYTGKNTVYHLDLYRINSQSELLNLDIDRYLNATEEIVLIEWADRLFNETPAQFLKLHFDFATPNTRKITVSWQGEKYNEHISGLK